MQSTQGTIEGFRLSPQQKHVWLLQQASHAYISQCAVRIEGHLDSSIFNSSLEDVVRRHEILRTTFHSLPGMAFPIQVIDDKPKLDVQWHDLQDLTSDVQAAQITGILQEQRRAFDPQRRPLLRVALLGLSKDQYLLAVTIAALCADGTTLNNFITDLMQVYAARLDGAELTDEPVQYTNFSEWLYEALEAEDTEKVEGEAYWRDKHLGDLPTVTLPFEEPPTIDGTFEPSVMTFNLPLTLVQQLQALAQALEVSDASILLSALQILCWHLDRQNQVTICQLTTGRKFEQLEDAFGLYTMYLPLPTYVQADLQFREVLQFVNEAMLANEVWQEFFSWEQIVPRLGGASERARFSIQFQFERWTPPETSGELRVMLDTLYSCSDSFKLKLACIQTPDKLDLQLHYDPQVYSVTAIEQLAAQLEQVMQQAVTHPEILVGDIDVLSRFEQHLLLAWNDTEQPFPQDICIHDLVNAQAEHTPDAQAIVSETETLSYRELNQQANQLAHYLQQLGVGPEKRVALCLERSPMLLVGLLGVLKAGGAYVPLDPALPLQRKRFILTDTQATVLLTQARLDSPLDQQITVVRLDADQDTIATFPDTTPDSRVLPDHLAYVLYTSGTTGTPKGVMIQHHGVRHLAMALQHAIYKQQSTPLRISLNAPLAFDASVKQIVQLCFGHTLVLVPEEARRDGQAFLNYLRWAKLDVLDCTPTQMRMLLLAGLGQQPEVFPPISLIGGEPLHAETCDFLVNTDDHQAYNVYGPTECTVDATVERVDRQSTPPTLGRPLANTQIYLLDARLRQVPIGVPGDLYISGPGVARGYLNQAGLTAEKFIPNPFTSAPGTRLYKTGDRARYRRDGRIEFLGRQDQQVKVRGFRIELGEIEASLQQYPAIREAAVIVREDAPGDHRLVAYIVPQPEHAVATDGQSRYTLPNGLAIVHQNANETRYLYHEIFEQQAYLKYGLTLPEDACVFDVGANIGMFSLFVSQYAPRARLYAFEPIQPIFEALRSNVQLHAVPAKLFQIGLSNSARSEIFTYYPRYSMMSGISKYASAAEEIEVVKRFLRNEQQSGRTEVTPLLDNADELLEDRFVGETYQSTLETLSHVIQAEGVTQIDLLKIDVQRAERDVLLGIDDSDWPKIRQIVMEVHDSTTGLSEGRIAQIVELLTKHGFTTYVEQDPLLEGTDRHMLYAARHPLDPQIITLSSNRGTHVAQPATEAVMLTPENLRSFLKEQLPEYMVPTNFVLLDRLPVTRNGKLDRQALPALESVQTELRAAYLAPRNQIEQTIAGIWQRALRLDKVGVHDNFFDLGGHSLILVQVHSQIIEAFNQDISMVDLFQHPTVSALAKFFEREDDEQESLHDIDDQAQKQIAALRQQQRLTMERMQDL